MQDLISTSQGIRDGRVLVQGTVYDVCVCGFTRGVHPDHAARLLRQPRGQWRAATERDAHRHMLHAHSADQIRFQDRVEDDLGDPASPPVVEHQVCPDDGPAAPPTLEGALAKFQLASTAEAVDVRAPDDYTDSGDTAPVGDDSDVQE